MHVSRRVLVAGTMNKDIKRERGVRHLVWQGPLWCQREDAPGREHKCKGPGAGTARRQAARLGPSQWRNRKDESRGAALRGPHEALALTVRKWGAPGEVGK